MNTLLLAPELFTTDSGIPRVLRSYLRVLVENATERDRVSFITLNEQTVDSQDLRGIPAERIRTWTACRGQKRTFVLAGWREARRQDLIVCGHLAQSPVAWAASLRYRRLRYVVLAHGIEAWRRLSVVQHLALRRAAQVWCVSDYTRQQLLRHNRLDPNRLVVVPNGLDPEFVVATAPAEAPRPPVILAVSRLSPLDPYKGIEHLIAAMPAVRRAVPDACLRIVGRGADADRLYALAQRQGSNGAIAFSGYVPDPELRNAFESARVFALPSAGEGFGLVYVEALAAGTPCVAANAGGATEILTPETGLFVPYGDVAQLSSALVAALTRDWDRGALLARARDFSYERFRKRVTELLAGMASPAAR